jgi:hypothetical protein
MKVRFRKQTRSITEHFIYINGEKFEFEEIYRTVTHIEGRRYSIVLTDPRMIKVLKDSEIINSPGRRGSHAATLGENGEKFITILKKKKKELEKKNG